MKKDISGHYSRCDICDAPFVSPLPRRWKLDVFKVGSRTMLQPHLPACPRAQETPEPGDG